MRKTKIVATVGPACNSPEVLRRLILAGVDVFRLNFSHGTAEEHARAVEAIREASQAVGRSVAILQDLQGPRIRTGPLAQGPVFLHPGQELRLTPQPVLGGPERVSITYANLPREVRPGDRILLADGSLELRVKGVLDGEVLTVVVRGGLLGEKKGVNLPDVPLSIPPLTEKDLEDLEVGFRLGVDYVALSFVQRPEDIERARDILRQRGAHTPIIVKIEKAEAVRRLEAILRVSDGVMVARGDLGVELSPEKVPLLQKRVIRLANQMGIPVITATQMLESMVSRPFPTRAEASDVANAILDGTDAVMLSEETALGKYPVEAVETMARIAQEVDASPERRGVPARRREGHVYSIAHAATSLAEDVGACALVVYTHSGFTAQVLSKERPFIPIFAFTSDPQVVARLSLWYGVVPFLGPDMENTDRLLDWMQEDLKRRGLVQPGDNLVFVRLSSPTERQRANLITVRGVCPAEGEGPASLARPGGLG